MNLIFNKIEEIYPEAEIKAGVYSPDGFDFDGHHLLFIDGCSIIDFIHKNNIVDAMLNEDTEYTVRRYNIMINEKISDRISLSGLHEVQMYREIRFRKDGICIAHFTVDLIFYNRNKLSEYDFMSKISADPYKYLFDWILRVDKGRPHREKFDVNTFCIHGNTTQVIVTNSMFTRDDAEKFMGLK